MRSRKTQNATTPSTSSLTAAGVLTTLLIAIIIISTTVTGFPLLPGNMVPFQKASLDNIVAAYYLNQPSRKFERPDTGYVGLIHENGSVQYVKTQGIVNGKLAWTPRGLYFSDQYQDYLIANNNRNIQKGAQNYISQSTLLTNSNDRVYSISSPEFEHDKLIMKVREMLPTSSEASDTPQVRELIDSSYGFAQCGDTTYAIGDIPAQGDDYSLRAAPFFTKGKTWTMPKLPSNQSLNLSETLPCIQNTIMQLSTREASKPSNSTEKDSYGYVTLELLQWNTKDGSYKFMPVTKNKTKWVVSPNRDFVISQGSVQGDSLITLDCSTGELYKIDTTTGDAQLVHTMVKTVPKTDRIQFFMQTTAKHIVLMHMPDPEQPAGSITYLDKQTLTPTKHIPLANNIRNVWNDFYADDFAVPPSEL